MAKFWRLFVLSLAALIADLVLVALPLPWAFPPFAFVAVLFVAIRQGEIPAMIQGFILGLLFDILNMDNSAGTFLILVCVGFSPWPFRHGRQLHKRFVQILLCVADVALAYGIRLALATGQPDSVAQMEARLNQSLIVAGLCAALFALAFPLLERLFRPLEESSP